MKTTRSPNLAFCHLVLLSTSILSGCGLTKAQLAATQSFAKASKSYPSAPAAVITTYADVYIAREAFDTSTVRGAGEVWKMSGQAVETYGSEQSDAKQLGAGLQIVSQYGDLLTKLSSSDFSQADEKAAGSLSTTIDNSVKEYNKEFGKSAPSIGKYVATGVDAIGEIYIRKRQAEELKWYVSEAEPMVETLTKDTDLNLSNFQKDLLPAEECHLAQALCTRQRMVVEMNRQQAEQVSSAVQAKLAVRSRRSGALTTTDGSQRPVAIAAPIAQSNCPTLDCPNGSTFLLSPESAQMVIDARLKVKLAEQALDSAKKANDQLLKAHQALNQSLQQKETLADEIEQIEQFAQAVSNANGKAKSSSSTNPSSANAGPTN